MFSFIIFEINKENSTMSKRIILYRHSKSSWEDLNIDDYDRQLNSRGLIDAEHMANIIGTKIILPDLILCSGSTRTRQTIDALRKKNPFIEIEYDDNLYLAEVFAIDYLISQVANEVETLLICAHNPGLTEFLNQKTNNIFDEIPTSCIVVIEFENYLWKDVPHSKGKLTFIEYPNMPKDTGLNNILNY